MILCRENLPVIIENHPFYDSLNKKIISETKGIFYKKGKINRDGGISNVRALKSDPYRISSPSIELVYQWILNLLRNPQFHGGKLKWVVDNSWLACYREGEFAVSHAHYPTAYSFVYFVRCPKGSSPLIFTTSGKRIKAENGKVVIFPGNLLHHVPKNKCDGRIVLAGNIEEIGETETLVILKK
tara:strand:+ start:179 stop:730 length:552 start_codon:yes stop_codon:yes gene_type:complete